MKSPYITLPSTRTSNLNQSSSTTRPPAPINLPTSRSPALQSSRQNDFSTYHLYSLRKSIDDKNSTNNKIRQQLKMQRQSSHKILSRIQSTMFQTSQNCVDLVTRFQEQKRKNEYLQKLVSHYEKQISQQKLRQYHNTMNNIENNEYDQLKNIFNTNLKQLETVVNKLNASQCQKRTKYEIVKSERRQRTVFSNQFNTFEKQVFDLEYEYKQVLMQSVLLEREFQHKMMEFRRVEQQCKKGLERVEEESKEMYKRCRVDTIDDDSFVVNDQMEENHMFVQSSFYRSKSKLNYVKMEKNQLLATSNDANQRNERKINNLEYLKLIKEILNDFSVNSVKELKQTLREINNKNLQHQDNHSLIQQLNEIKTTQISTIQDDIYEWGKKIDQLLYKKQHPTQTYKPSKTHKQRVKNIKKFSSLIQSIDQQIIEEKQSISSFNNSEGLETLKKLLQVEQLQQNSHILLQGQMSSNIDATMMQKIQQKFTQIMGLLPDPKSKSRTTNNRRSILFESPTSQYQQKDSSLMMTQKSICPLFQPSKGQHNAKRMKTGVSQLGGHNGLKKLSNLLKNQSKMRGPIDIVSKDEMIREASEAFDKEGIVKMEKFQVRYT